MGVTKVTKVQIQAFVCSENVLRPLSGSFVHGRHCLVQILTVPAGRLSCVVGSSRLVCSGSTSEPARQQVFAKHKATYTPKSKKHNGSKPIKGNYSAYFLGSGTVRVHALFPCRPCGS